MGTDEIVSVNGLARDVGSGYHTAHELRAQADVLDDEAKDLRRQAVERGSKALALRSRADAMDSRVESVQVAPASRSADLMGRVAEALHASGRPMGSGELADALGVRVVEIRLALRGLAAIGMLTREGMGRSTKYAVE